MRTLVFALSITLAAQAESPKSKQAEVDRIFAGFNTHTPGCAVGVAYEGDVALRSGYGMADLERNVPITADTIFESGSVAKQFTATAILLLAQQGKLSLDDPLRKYLPELPDYGTPLTIRHVLSHISGLREWRLVATFSGTPEGTYVLSNRDLLQIASRQKALNFDPGTAYSYTNTGFNILTIVVERMLGNGTTFQDFTREAIFEPLKMTHTSWRADYRTVVPNRALAYAPAPGGGWIQDTPIENIIGAGGMLSTVGDWLLWNENFSHVKVGGAELIKAQQTPATLKNGKTIAYAAGLTIDSVDGLREVSHGGSTGGYRTWIGRYPDRSVSIAVMCNSAQANPVQLGRETARLWTGVAATSKPAPFAIDQAKLEALTGMYRKLRDNTVAELSLKDGKLMIDGRVELIPSGAGRFSAGETEVVFEGARFRELSPNGDTEYERVEHAHPSEADLSAFVGEYESAETSSTLTVAAKNGELTLAIASNPAVRLRPTFRDAFMMPRGGASIRFIRDSAAKVTGLSAGDDRVWDLRFQRRLRP
jgi:CubicO group peptidase (beta-lactamase class C family)